MFGGKSEKYTVEAFLTANDAGLSRTLKESKKNIDDFITGAERAEKSSGKFGSALKGAAKVAGGAMLGLTTAAAAGIAAITTSSVRGFADFEQLVGGVETLFGAGGMELAEYAKSVGKTVDQVKSEYETLKNNESRMLDYSAKAFKTAGLSQNAYIETVTGFSASLISSLGGDTEAAVEYADRALVAMSDNANKMGSSMESIQNAYQGFAKQNYTMLDNLKLGYGGTKEEMQRLLDDAEKLSGIKFDISSFADITEAIQVIQEEMGIAGTTALEAEETISGSWGMLQGAFSNFVVGLSKEGADLDQLTQDMAYSFSTLIKNIGPVVERVLGALPTAIDALLGEVGRLLPALISALGDLIQKALGTVLQIIPTVMPALMDGIESLLTMVTKSLPDIMNAAVRIVQSLIDGIGSMLPTLIPMLFDAIRQMTESIGEMLPTLIQSGILLIQNLMQGFSESIDVIIMAVSNVIEAILETIVENLPVLLEAGLEVLSSIIKGITENIPLLIESMKRLIESARSAIEQALPLILEVGISLLKALIEGILETVPELISGAASLLSDFIDTIISLLPEIVDTGIDLLLALIDGIIESLPEIINAVLKTVNTLIQAVTENLPKILEAGIEILLALVNGLIEAIPKLIPAMMQGLTTIVNTVIQNLPMIIKAAVQIILALVQGILENLPMIISSIVELIGTIATTISSNLPLILEMGWQLIKALVTGLVQAVPMILNEVPRIFSKMASKFREINWASIGTNLVKGIWNGISNVTGWVLEKIRGFGQSILKGIKGIFGIRSPSKETAWMGEMLGKGLGLGVEDQVGYVSKMADKLSAAAMPDVEGAFDMNYTGSAIRGAVDLSAANIAMPTYEPEFTFKLGNRTLKGIRRDLTDAQTRELELVEVFG